jgi:hypothetical protein
MKQIQPVVFPLNLGTATILNCTGSDNFSNTLTILYQLLTEKNILVQAGNLYLTGFDYEAYNTSTDGNEYIYQWTATQLGVTLV